MIYQLNKPLGLLSRDLVDYVRYRVPEKKVGHGGALDPLASGSLLIATGVDTKKCTELLKKDKTYQFSMILGLSTPTGDLESHKIMVDGSYWEKKLSKEDLIKNLKIVLKSFVGNYKQVVPLYSSVKVDGYRLREIARKGQVTSIKNNFLYAKYKEKNVVLSLPEKDLQVYNLYLKKIVMLNPVELLKSLYETHQQIIQNVNLFYKRTQRKVPKIVYTEIIDSVENIIHLIEVRVQKTSIIPVVFCRGKVSSGTYIRKLAVDIAQKLNTVATCSSIHREIITKKTFLTSSSFDY